MDTKEKKLVLEKAKEFFRDLAQKHIKNTIKCKELSVFDLNPFLDIYLANYFTGDSNPESIAKVLLYPRILGTSIKTSFGQNIQKFITEVLGGYGSAIDGIDIEFTDQLDTRKKYCQIKSGPNCINFKDVDPIKGEFTKARRTAQTNHLDIGVNDLMIGVLYGNEKMLNNFFVTISKDYPVVIGKEFWYRLTGEDKFYENLIEVIKEVSIEVDATRIIEETLDSLTIEVSEHFDL